jgi:hypothetical protein
MITYIVIALDSNTVPLDSAVNETIPKEDRHQLEAGKWLVSSSMLTSKDVSDKLGLPSSSTFIICPIRGYFGRARSDIWEWLAAKSSSKS